MLFLPTSCPDCYGFTMEVEVGLGDSYEARCVACGYCTFGKIAPESPICERCYLEQVSADQLRDPPNFRPVRLPTRSGFMPTARLLRAAWRRFRPDTDGILYCGEVKYFWPLMIGTGKSMRPTVPAGTGTHSVPLRRLCRPRIGILARPTRVRLP